MIQHFRSKRITWDKIWIIAVFTLICIYVLLVKNFYPLGFLTVFILYSFLIVSTNIQFAYSFQVDIENNNLIITHEWKYWYRKIIKISDIVEAYRKDLFYSGSVVVIKTSDNRENRFGFSNLGKVKMDEFIFLMKELFEKNKPAS